ECATVGSLFDTISIRMRTLPILSGIALILTANTMAEDAKKPPATEPAHDVWIDRPHGQLIYHAFAAAPYPHASRANGYQTKSAKYPKDPHYVDSTVAVFLPKSFHAAGPMNYVVHFHGHRHHVTEVMGMY